MLENYYEDRKRQHGHIATMAVYSVENNRNNKKLRISRFVRQRGFKSSEVVALNLYILHEEVVDPGLPIFLITIPSWRFNTMVSLF